jgi:hypothetical protein
MMFWATSVHHCGIGPEIETERPTGDHKARNDQETYGQAEGIISADIWENPMEKALIDR